MIAIIPARGGSTRIPKKNIAEFHGKPLIAYSILTASISGLYDGIYVSTDDDDIAKIAWMYGAQIIQRSKAMSENDIGTQEVMRDALIHLNYKGEYATCIYATAPLMEAEDLRAGYQMLANNKAMDYAFSVGDQPLHDAGQFYHGKTEAFLGRRPLVGSDSIMVRIPPERVCDINTMYDMEKAKQMFLKLEAS